MTTLLNKAFEKASHLPENIQDVLAEELLREIEGELKWDETLAKSQDTLEKMADKAVQDFKTGKTREMGIDEL